MGVIKNKKSIYLLIFLIFFIFSISFTKKEEVFASCSIGVNGTPQASAFANGKVYVTRSATKQITAFDATTDTIGTTVSASDAVFSTRSGMIPNNLLFGDKLFSFISGATDGFTVLDTTTDTIVNTTLSASMNNAYDGVVKNSKYYQIMRGSGNNLAIVDPTTYNVTYKALGTSFPEKIVANNSTNEIYVIFPGSPGKVVVVDTSTDTVGATISVGNIGTGLSTGTVVGDYLYVLNTASNTVSIIDLNTKTVAATTAVGNLPKFITSAGDKVYIGNATDVTVSVIDQAVSFSAVSSTITLSSTAISYMTPIDNGSKIYVANGGPGTIKVINTSSDSVVKTISGLASITSGIETNNNKFYGVASASGGINIIDTVSDEKITNCGDSPGSDTLAPTLSSFTSTTTNSVYGTGDVINIIANFNENLASGSTMTVVLDTGASITLSNISGTTLYGYYTVSSGQNSSDLTVSSITSASVLDSSANTGTTYSVPSSPNNIADTSNIVIDTQSPTGFNISVDPISSTPSDFSDPVITFSATDNLSGTLTYAVSVNGGSFSTTTSPYSASGIDPDVSNSVTVMACDEAGNCSTYTVYFYPAVMIDAPTIESRTDILDTEVTIIEPTSSSYDLASVVATLDGNPVTIVCSPVVGTGVKTTTCSISGGIEAPSDHSNDGTHILVVSATNSNSVLGRSSQSFLIDTIAPTITAITTPDNDGTYSLGEELDIVLTLSESVVLGSSVTATFDTGHTLVFTCASATCSTLSATYTVESGESTSDLSVSSFSSSSLEDVVGNINSSTSVPGSDNLDDSKDIVIDTEAPATPSAPDLTADTDTGNSSTDNVTHVDEIELVGSCTSSDTIKLYRDGEFVSSVTCSSSSYSFSDTLPSYGTYAYKIKAVDSYDNESGFSSELEVTYEEESVADIPISNSTVRYGSIIGRTNTNSNPNNTNNNPDNCEPYLKKFIKLGANNDEVEVKKLETFLNSFENAGLKVDGIYDKTDFEAVKAFQSKYKEVLDFWGLSQPTGYVYITTQKTINRIYCENQNQIKCPYFTQFTKKGDVGVEVEKIKRFLNNNEGTSLTVSNVYDDDLFNEVKKFQIKYKNQVLDPWGMKNASGIWYQSTRKKANDLIGCFAPQKLDNGVILE